MTTLSSLHRRAATDDRQPGGTPLGVVFWLHGVIPSNALWAAALWAFVQDRTGLMLGLFAVLLVFMGWIIPAVWRAAPRATVPGYGVAARGLTVAWGLNTLLLVFFLVLQKHLV